MKRKIPRIVMVFVALALVMSLVAAVAGTNMVIAGTNSHSRMDLPSTGTYQMMPDSDIWDLTAAADGTLFALVQDTSGNRWTPAYSNFAVFKSTDSGVTWSLMWHIPATDPTPAITWAAGVPIEIVPCPDYDDADPAKDTVFMNTDDHLYRSNNGGSSFTRVNTCPGVDVGGGLFTSLDVGQDLVATGDYVAMVGVVDVGGTGTPAPGTPAPGVYTWNENGLSGWVDKEVGNMVATNNYGDVIDVAYSPKYGAASPGDGMIVALVNETIDWDASGTLDVVMTFYLDSEGLWGGPPPLPPSPVPTDVTIAAADAAAWATIAFADDWDLAAMPYVFVGTAGMVADDFFSIKAQPPLAGGSLLIAAAGLGMAISDVLVTGMAALGTAYVGVVFPPATGQAQVLELNNILIWPTMTPALKPPSGNYPVWIADTGTSSTILAAGGTDGPTTSGVSRLVEGLLGSVYNGISLLDDITVSTDLWGVWFGVSMLCEEVSWDYANDGTLYIVTDSGWSGALSLWRLSNAGGWERILVENLVLPTGISPVGKVPVTTPGLIGTINGLYWWVRIGDDFPSDPYLFLLGAINAPAAEVFWYSLDKGDTWAPMTNVPPTAGLLSESGWWAVNNTTIYAGDNLGWVYKTTTCGNYWTDGASTDLGGVVYDVKVNGDFVLAGVSYTPGGACEVWINQDGGITDFTIVGSELMWEPTSWTFGLWWWWGLDPVTVCNFGPDFDGVTNTTIYGGASGSFDWWQWNPAGTAIVRNDSTECGIFSTSVDLADTQASTWSLVYGQADLYADIGDPVMSAVAVDLERDAFISGIRAGHEGTLYAPLAVYTWDDVVGPLGGRYTDGAVLRSLDGVAWEFVDQGLGPYDGCWLVRVVPGTNLIFTMAHDWWDWRFKLTAYEDTICQAGPAAVGPVDGAAGIGDLVGSKVNVTLTWAAVGSTVYEWQVDDDSLFTAPLVAQGTTSETFAQVTALEPQSTYCWRARVVDPVLGPWSGPYCFTTVSSVAVVAPELLNPPSETGVDADTGFQWTKLAWANSYYLQVATDSSYGAAYLVIDQTLAGQAYQPAVALDYSTTYYWHVKASNTDTGAESDWSGDGIFTTASGALPAGTPGWVWAVIGIGAVLLIAVIVLIMRTRRAA